MEEERMEAMMKFCIEHGYPPTREKLMALWGLKSKSTVQYWLCRLEGKGLVQRDGSHFVPTEFLDLMKPETILAHCSKILVENRPVYTPMPRKSQEKKIAAQGGDFNGLAMLDFEVDPKSRKAVEETCEACALSEEANCTMCKECPLVDYLRRLNHG